MPLTFYPHAEDMGTGTLTERIEHLMEAAERYKASVLETGAKSLQTSEVKQFAPKDMNLAFNWDEIAIVLREIRELTEATKDERIKKAKLLFKLSEVYEVLRSAKMSKLEAVRLALVSESTQLQGGATPSI